MTHPSAPASLRTTLAVFAVVGCAATGQAAEAATAEREFELPADRAAKTLRLFAEQAAVEVVFANEFTAHVETRALHGRYAPEAALQLLLAGTGLIAERNPRTGAFLVRRLAPQAPPRAPPEAKPAPPPASPKSAQSQPKEPPSVKTRTFLALLAGWIVTAGSADAQTASVPPKDEAVVLSPFTVSSDKYEGYAAQETLAGTRLRTSLRDVASSMAILTPEFMQDLGVTSLDKALIYTPSVDTIDGDNTTGRETGSYLRYGNGQGFTIRGFATNTGAQAASNNFFTSLASNDIYNVESIALSRGPNAMLFGVGGAEGVSVSSIKRAQLQRPKSQVALQYDRWSSRRVAFDHNQPIVPGTLALRLNTLHAQKREFRLYEGTEQNRVTAGLTWQPFRQTQVVLNHEGYSIRRNIVPLVWAFDGGVLQWLAKGKPTIEFLPQGQLWTSNRPYVDANGRPVRVAPGVVDADGLVDARADFDPLNALIQYGVNYPTYINGLGLANPFVNQHYQTYVQQDRFGGVQGVVFQPADPWALYGLDRRANLNLGTWDEPADRLHGRWTQLFIEQKILDGLYLELAGNVALDRRIFAPDGLSPGATNLRIDVDRYLPDGTLNPGYLIPYAEATTAMRDAVGRNREYRATLSYERNLADIHRWLGRHSFAALGLRSQSDSDTDSLRFVNLASIGRTGWPNDAVSGTNALFWRSYFPQGRIPYPLPNGFQVLKNLNQLSGYNLIASNAADAAPVRLGLRPVGRPTKTRFEDDALSLAWQGRWFKERLVTVVGYRTDRTRSYDVPLSRNYIDPAIPGATTDPLQRFYDLARDIPLNSTPAVSARGVTRTYGAVYHAWRWLSFTYNLSRNFSPVSNASWRNFEGVAPPNTAGQTEDYGVRFYLLDGRLSVSANRFVNSAKDQARGAASWIGGPRAILSHLRTYFKDRGDSHFAAMAPVGGYMVDTGEVSDTWSFDATGYELSIVFNPSSSWRVSVTGSQNENVMGEHLASFGRYLQTEVPYQGLPTWRKYIAELRKVAAGQSSNQFDLDPNSLDARTLASTEAAYIENQANIAERAYNDEKAIEGVTTNRNGKYALNGVAAYNFPRDGKLRGWTIGGNFRWRSPSIIGYERQLTAAGVPSGIINVRRPFRGPEYWDVGAMVAHQRRLWGLRNVRLQLNIENLFDWSRARVVAMDFDSEGVFGKVDAAVPIRYEMRRPRNFVLSATIDL